MGIVLLSKKIMLEGGKKYNKFMYKNDLLDKKNSSIDNKLCKVNAQIEKKAEKKIAKKEDKRKMKEIPSNRKFEFHVPSFFKKDVEVEESEETPIFFFDKEDNSYQGSFVTTEDFLDKNLKPVTGITGKELLSRDFEKEELYVKDDESNKLRILSTKKVVCENQDEDERFVLIETKYEYFIIHFDVVINF